MRKLFTFASAMIMAASMMGQQKYVVKGDVRTVPATKIAQEPSTNMQRNSPAVGTTPDYSTTAAKKILSLPNPYGYTLNRGQKQIGIVPSLNAVAFVNRQDPNIYGGGTGGSLRYAISTDQGDNWSDPQTVGGIINPNEGVGGFGRDPNTILFKDGGDAVSNLKLHTVFTVLDGSGSGWNGLGYVTVQDPTTTGAYSSQEDYAYQGGTGLYASYGLITERVHGSGNFYTVHINLEDDNLYVFRGDYDGTASVQWACVDTLMPDWNLSIDGNASWAPVGIAFSPDGSKGYIAMLGDLTGGRDSAYFPILAEFNAATGRFGTPYEVDINLPCINSYIQQWVDDTGAPVSPDGKATCAFAADLTVDYQGEPHLFTIVGPAAVDGTPYSISSGFGMRGMDINRFGGDWNIRHVAEQWAFREIILDDFSIDPNPSLTRSLDGKYIMYTWSDTDTTGLGSNANQAPNIWGVLYNVATGLVSDSINWTQNDPTWNTKARVPKTPEHCFINSNGSACGQTFEVPVTIINFSDLSDPTKPADIYYFTDISYDCASATKTTEVCWLDATTSVGQSNNGFNELKAFPSPASDLLNVSIALTGKDDVQLTVTAMNGQTVMRKAYKNTTKVVDKLDVSALTSGIYFLQATTSKGTQSFKFMVK